MECNCQFCTAYRLGCSDYYASKPAFDRMALMSSYSEKQAYMTARADCERLRKRNERRNDD